MYSVIQGVKRIPRSPIQKQWSWFLSGLMISVSKNGRSTLSVERRVKGKMDVRISKLNIYELLIESVIQIKNLNYQSFVRCYEFLFVVVRTRLYDKHLTFVNRKISLIIRYSHTNRRTKQSKDHRNILQLIILR